MAYFIVRDNIVNIEADVVVNPVNPEVCIGGGTETAIYNAAGRDELLVARESLGILQPGNIGVTDGFKLKAKHIIHASGPVWTGGEGEEEVLRSCYDKCLEKALELKAESIAFPLLATGTYDFPKDLALRIAISSFSAFLDKHDMDITLAVFDKESVETSEKVFGGLEKYIDDNYVEEQLDKEYLCESVYFNTDAEEPLAQPMPAAAPKEKPAPKGRLRGLFSKDKKLESSSCFGAAPRPNSLEPKINSSCFGEAMEEAAAPEWYSEIKSLKDIQNTEIITFGQYLQQLINKKGMKNADVYNKANIDKRYFSKIINDKIKPSKEKLLAICIGLRLNLDEMNDFLNMAGFAISRCNKVDLVVEYHIVNGIYNIFDVEIALFNMGLPALCSY